MSLKRRLAAFAAVIAALAVGAPLASASVATIVGAPLASASVATIPVKDPATSPSCPAGYNGPTNLATGCPFWLMS
jgi:uncharacterized membrane protein YraQ (UPF0718 family)